MLPVLVSPWWSGSFFKLVDQTRLSQTSILYRNSIRGHPPKLKMIDNNLLLHMFKAIKSGLACQGDFVIHFYFGLTLSGNLLLGANDMSGS
jgi:hypothetical protein